MATNDDGTVMGHGPTSGSTPSGDSDLHDSGANPYATSGSPRVDSTATTDDGFSVTGYGGPSGTYYTNPPTSGSGNPYSAGVPDWGEELNLDALYGDIRANRQPTKSPDPTSADFRSDAGHGPDGMGNS